MNQSKRNLFILSALSAVLTANLFYMAAPAALAKKSSKSKAKTTTVETKTVTQGDAESAIRNQLSSLSDAATKADAEKMASFFALDGAYVNEDGLRVEGRQSLKEHFARNVRPEMEVAVKLEPQVIRIIGNDSAWIEGTTTRQSGSGKSLDARFTMLLNNQNGNWIIQSASETSVVAKDSSSKLSELDWLVGDWVAEQGNAKVRMTAEKVGNGHFFHLRYVISKPGEAPKIDTQVIGWDPNRDQIVSWHFDSSGGYGYGKWRKLANKWVINAEGVEQSGWNSAATNVISAVDKNSFQWQSMRRTADGLTFADTEPLTVKRVSQ